MRKGFIFAVLLLAATVLVSAQDTQIQVDDLLGSAEQWAKENLNDDALAVLQNIDREQVKQFFTNIQQQLHGNYVVELAPLKEAARTLQPLLEKHEETLPYALWLKTRLDYLDVAEHFRETSPVPKPEPGVPPKPAPNPAPQKEREFWIEKVAARPWPENAKACVSRLKPVFSAQKVPPELVWLAEVESSFDPRARSPAGAAGMFQLMPETAKRFGLRVFPFDQRYNEERSAEAAAKYLRFLYGKFKDWRLALAAYNAGEGTVENLMKKSQARSFEGIATRLPAETQLYVPKVEATVLRREGVKLSELSGG